MSEHTNIRGRLALITGASGGIGAACARNLTAEGLHLALTYSSNRESIEALAQELQTQHIEKDEHANGDRVIRQPHLRISVHKVDLTSTEEIENLFQQIQKEHHVPVDILVSNAGYGKRIRDVWDIPLSEFDHTLNVNLRAPFQLVKGVVEGMKNQRWGRIIFVSSIAAYGAGINGCHYAASKGGVISMMKNLSSRLAEYNISVNDVAPALVGSTGMIPNEKSVEPVVVQGIPLGRLCTPEEVAIAVGMFAKTGFATGQSLVVGGGLR